MSYSLNVAYLVRLGGAAGQWSGGFFLTFLLKPRSILRSGLSYSPKNTVACGNYLPHSLLLRVPDNQFFLHPGNRCLSSWVLVEAVGLYFTGASDRTAGEIELRLTLGSQDHP